MSAQRFCICSVARSGTNYFISKMLGSTELLLAWEPFNKEVSTWFDRSELFETLDPRVQAELQNLKLRNENPMRFYERVFSPRSKIDLKGTKALGYKIFISHNPDVFAKSSREEGLKIIVVERRNRLASFSSEIIARKRNQYTGSYGSNQQKILFDKDYFEMYRQATDYTFASSLYNIRNSGGSYVHLFYEDFSLSDKYIQEACEFIGISGSGGSSWLIKQNCNDLLQRFFNPEAVVKHMEEKGLPFLL